MSTFHPRLPHQLQSQAESGAAAARAGDKGSELSGTSHRPYQFGGNNKRKKLSRKEQRKQKRVEKKQKKVQFITESLEHRQRRKEHERLFMEKRKKLNKKSAEKKRIKAQLSENAESGVTQVESNSLNRLEEKSSLKNASLKKKSVTFHKNLERVRHFDKNASSKSVRTPGANDIVVEESDEQQQVRFLDSLVSNTNSDLDAMEVDLYKKLGIISKQAHARLQNEMQMDGLDAFEKALERLDEDSEDEENQMEDDFESENEADLESLSTETVESEEDHLDEKELEERRKVFAEKSIKRKKQQQDLFGSESTEKYVPPHIKKLKLDEEQMATKDNVFLSKKINGLINRLSESNVMGIANQISSLFESHSVIELSQIFAKSITSLLQEGFLESIIQCQAFLVVFCHRTISSQVGATVLELVCDEIQSLMAKHSLGDMEKKKLISLFNLISGFYNFSLISNEFMFDLLQHLVLSGIDETKIELILVVCQFCGFALRKENPTRLKEFIFALHKDDLVVKEKSSNSRIVYMLEVIDNLKNNRQKMSDDEFNDANRRLMKLLDKETSSSSSDTMFRVGWKDISEREDKGRWWLVGSAWKGNSPKQETESKLKFSDSLLEMAKKQRMSTDAKRQIFCIIMSAEDFLDAFQKLSTLSLTALESRDIIRVLCHCCKNENCFNPYYAHLAKKLSSSDRSHQFTLQLYMWDQLKLLTDDDSALSTRQSANLAKLLAFLCKEFTLSLSVLKVVSFMQVTKKGATLFFLAFFKELFSTIKEEKQIVALFERISFKSELKNLRAGLNVFLEKKFIPFMARSCDDLEKMRHLVTLSINSMDKQLDVL